MIRRWVNRSQKRKRSKVDLKAATNDEAIRGHHTQNPGPDVKGRGEDSTFDCTTKSPVSLTDPQEKGPLTNETELTVAIPPIIRECEPTSLPLKSARVTTDIRERHEDTTIDMSLPELIISKRNLEQRILGLYQSQKLLQSQLDRVDKRIAYHTSKQNLDSKGDAVVDMKICSGVVMNEVSEVDLAFQPHNLASTFHAASKTSRVSLEQQSPLTNGRRNTIDASNTIAEEFNGNHDIIEVRVPIPTISKRCDEVSDDPKNDDDTIQSTQTMDPNKDNVLLPSNADAIAIPTKMVPFDDRSSSDYEKKRKPLQTTSTNHDNRKKTKPICDTATDQEKDKRKSIGWVTNQPARVFLRQMEHRPPQPIEESKSTSKPVNQKSAKAPTKWISKSAEDRLEEEPPYAYKEVVRKQCERQALNCYDCPNCQKFYAALRKAGHEEDIAILSRRGETTRQTNDVDNLVVNDIRDGNVSFGRHRARFAQTETPVDFWELDFIDERDAATTPSFR
jgi:DNA repair protein endonuclease SAE2/CtIP C-terminus